LSSLHSSPRKQVSPSVSRRNALPHMGQPLNDTRRFLERVGYQAEAGRRFVCLISRKSTQILIGGRVQPSTSFPKAIAFRSRRRLRCRIEPQTRQQDPANTRASEQGEHLESSAHHADTESPNQGLGECSEQAQVCSHFLCSPTLCHSTPSSHTGAQHPPKLWTTTSPLRNRYLERSDEQKNSEFNTCENNRTVANWSRTEHSVNGASDGSAWAASQATLCTNGRDITRSVRRKNQRASLSFSLARFQAMLTPLFSESIGGESGDDQVSAAATPERTPRRNEEERRDFLNSDPRALVVKEWEVQCRACQKWIKLGKQRKYDLTPWSQHCGRCTGELSV